MRRAIAIRQFYAASFLVGAVLLAAHCACSPAAVRALDVAGYTAALGVCRVKGKEAKSYAIYEVCALEADQRYGVQP